VQPLISNVQIGIRAWCFKDERAVRRSVGMARAVVIKHSTAVVTAETAAAAILETVKIGPREKMYGMPGWDAQNGTPLCKMPP
jgi:hypothetical protein